MLRKLTFSLVLLSSAFAFHAGCTRGPSIAEANRKLAGKWELALGHDCRDYGIRSDTLILHGSGRLEQHFVSVFNQRYDASDERWSYSPDDHINLETRRDFFTKQPPNEVIGVPIRENLIVEFGNPSVIVLNPDSDCFYRKVGPE
jgi:hypothetical protein